MNPYPIIISVPDEDEYRSSTVIRVQKDKWNEVKEAMLKVLSNWRWGKIYFDRRNFKEERRYPFNIGAFFGTIIVCATFGSVFFILPEFGRLVGLNGFIILILFLGAFVGVLTASDMTLDWIHVHNSSVVYVELQLGTLERIKFLDDLSEELGYDITETQTRDLWKCRYCGTMNEKTLQCQTCGAKRP